ncbi:MAG: hypothetical protein LYZ69_06695 [Nitrososphaerales archaeon]|nr:hypothetical protein [Nitrososphaerales archaeon]
MVLLLAPQLGVFDMNPSTGTATPIKHVIVIMQENHSFDNYFGTYPTANGTLVNNVTSKLEPVNGIPDHVCVQYGRGCLSPRLTNTTSPANPVEGQLAYENDYASGSGFPNTSGPQSMVYFDYHSIPAYWDYAEEYGLADNYYAAVLSETTPNRLITFSGDTAVSENYGPPPYLAYNSTIMNQLTTAGLTWGYYDLLNVPAGSPSVYPMNYISGLPVPEPGIRNISSLLSELDAGSGLPSVSFVNSLGNSNLTEHPPFNPTTGETWVVSIVNRVMQSPYWDTTAVFIAWDEGGGFYDHVTPPVEFTIDHNFSRELVGLGQRVLLLAISPYSKTNYVSHLLLSHLSLLHFIDYNWNLAPLNDRVASSNLPLDFFDFGQQPRLGVQLTASGPFSESSYPVPLRTAGGKHTAEPNGAQLVLIVVASAAVAALLGSLLLLLVERRRARNSP